MDTISIENKFKWLARMGYASRGVIYLVIGALAMMAALGVAGGETTDARGAIVEILDEPFGHVMTILLIIGLFGYSAWRLVQTFKDVDDHGTDFKGLAIRFGLFVSAITHAALAIFAIGLVTGDGGSSSSSASGSGWLEGGLAQLVVGAVGVGFIIAGFAHIYKGWTARFERYMHIPNRYQPWARRVCQFGLIARGIVWGIVGWFFIDSARKAYSGDIAGLNEALDSLARSGSGTWLLGIAAAGLFAFGVYSILEALFRRINPEMSGPEYTAGSVA